MGLPGSIGQGLSKGGKDEEPYGIHGVRDQKAPRDGAYHGRSGADCETKRGKRWFMLRLADAHNRRCIRERSRKRADPGYREVVGRTGPGSIRLQASPDWRR